jgi:hypothetical protein
VVDWTHLLSTCVKGPQVYIRGKPATAKQTFVFPVERFFFCAIYCKGYLHGVTKMTTSVASYRVGDNYAAFLEEPAPPNFHNGSVEAAQTLAHNIAFTVAKSRYNASRASVVTGEKSSGTSEFGRGYAMDYFLSLRRYSRRPYSPKSRQKTYSYQSILTLS